MPGFQSSAGLLFSSQSRNVRRSSCPAVEFREGEPVTETDQSRSDGVTRRVVLTTGAATAAFASTPLAAPVNSPPAKGPSHAPVPVHLRVNGTDWQLALDPRVTLLDALREHLHLTGSTKGCEHGPLGECPVLANGRTSKERKHVV